MRVALDVGPLRGQPAGVGVYVASMARALAELLGPQGVALFGRRPDAEGLPAVSTSLSRSARLPYPIWVELAGGRAARLVDAPVAHFTDALLPLIPGLRPPPSVLTVQDLTLATTWWTHRVARLPRIPLMLASIRGARAVIVPSRVTADDVIRLSGASTSNVHIVPLAPRADFEADASDAAVAAVLKRYQLSLGRYILAVGTLEPRKNHLRLLAAYERLAERREIGGDVRFVVTGAAGWGSGSIVRRLRESAYADRVVTTGYVPPATLAVLLQGAGAVAYVSVAEGFGLPILEAMACGAAVVTSNVSPMREVAGDAAFLVDPLEVDSIGRGLRAALDARDLDASGVAARSVAHAARYSWRRTAMETIAVYEAVA